MTGRMLTRRCFAAAGLCLATGVAALAQQTPPAVPPGAPVQGDQSAQEVMLTQRPCLMIPGEASWDDGYDVLTRSFRTLAEEAAKARIESTGRPLAHFTQTDDFGFKFSAILTLAAEAPAGMVFGQDAQPGKTPGGRTMRFSHQGAYDEIDTTYEAITAYLDEKGLTAKGQFLEEYLNDPKGSDDTSLEVNIYVFID